MSNHFYTYYVYEEFGRGYIGSRGSKVRPELDPYMGSFSDPTFNPTEKIIISIHRNRAEALEAEIKLHDFFSVGENPHFANRINASTVGLCSSGMIRVHDGKKEKLVHPDKIPPGHVRGRLVNPNSYICPDHSKQLHHNTGKNFLKFKEDAVRDPKLLTLPIRKLGEMYETSHSSIRRWKTMLDRSSHGFASAYSTDLHSGHSGCRQTPSVRHAPRHSEPSGLGDQAGRPS